MYNRVTSFSCYPSSTEFKELTSGLTDAAVQEMRSKVLKVNIYYEFLKYNWLYETPAISVVSLLGGLGGTLGKVYFILK